MSNRSWFYASNGQQQGPYPEAQLRDLITRGTVSADTLVWTEGMSGWQRAGEIPGLVPGRSAPPSISHPGRPPAMDGSYSGGPLSIDFGILEFAWRTLVLVVGLIFIIPTPWVLVWYLKWIVPCVQVPGRPNLSFEGEAMTIVPWFFGFVVLMIGVSLIGSELLSNLMILVQIALYWLFLKWFIANLAVQRGVARSQFLRLGLGLRRVDHSWGYLHHHHYRLGLGLRCWDAVVLPEHPGHAARSPLHRKWTGVLVARNRGWSGMLLYHPNSVGVSMDVAMAGFADRFGGQRRARERISVTCAGAPSLPARPMPPACRRA